MMGWLLVGLHLAVLWALIASMRASRKHLDGARECLDKAKELHEEVFQLELHVAFRRPQQREFRQ